MQQQTYIPSFHESVERQRRETITLRPYQRQAIDKILWAQKLEGNDLCVLPTGAGKSIVIAYLAKELNQDILILQPSKEILEQNYKKLCNYVDADEIGIYSASMDEKTINRYTFATIQSIYKKPELFKHFKMVIIDECHGVNPKNLQGMFTKFLKEIGNPKVVGFTATPYRMFMVYEFFGGMLYGRAGIKLINRLKERFWSRIIFNVNNGELLEQGYLAPLEYIDKSIITHEEIPWNASQSDFDLVRFEAKISVREQEIVDTVNYGLSIAKSVLVFCSSVRQAHRLAEFIPGAAAVDGKTDKKERERIIEGFKSRDIKVVFNVGVLTTGFDHPSLDCIILIRPTKSIALYYQMLGRGVRLSPGKTSCKVIDLTSTVRNIGRVETIKVERQETGWELISEAGSWHGKQLYSFAKSMN